VGLVTHANSITLTPGTITVEADHDEFLVHALTRENAEGLAGSEMDRRVRRLEGED
jgi:multicomponent Na+:H+ antiporter subunit E